MRLTLSIFAFLLFAYSNTIAQSASSKVSYKTESNILYRTGGQTDDYIQERCRLDICYPENVKQFTTIVWFHGGGLTSGEKSIPKYLTNHNLAVVAVNYRLSPKVKSPAFIDDAAAAVAWVFRNIEHYGGDPGKIIVSGHSAGGYLACMIGLDRQYLDAYGLDANKIEKLIPFSGQMITHFVIRKELGIPETQPLIDQFAPLFHVRKDAPPLYLITGDRELELLGRYEENAYMARMMKISGHQQTMLYELDGYNHVEMAQPAFDLLLRIIGK
jgi:acetyl esterase/lipase